MGFFNLFNKKKKNIPTHYERNGRRYNNTEGYTSDFIMTHGWNTIVNGNNETNTSINDISDYGSHGGGDFSGGGASGDYSSSNDSGSSDSGGSDGGGGGD